MTSTMLRRSNLAAPGAEPLFCAMLRTDPEEASTHWIEVKNLRTGEVTRLAEFDTLDNTQKAWKQLIEQAPKMIGDQPC